MSLRRFYYDESLAALTAEVKGPMKAHDPHKICFPQNEIPELVELQATHLWKEPHRNVVANKVFYGT